MASHNSSKATPDATLGENPVLSPPFSGISGNLGINPESQLTTVIMFYDAAGVLWQLNPAKCDPVEWALKHIDFFESSAANRLLAGAALHFGLPDVYALIDGRSARADKHGDAA